MVYIIGKDGKPLMPTNKHAYVRMLLKAGKAKAVCTLPFTIQLLYGTAGNTQPATLGIDPGRTNIGVSVRAEEGKCLFAAELITRNKDVPKLMCSRREFRGQRRSHRRQKAQRREKACSGTERVIRRILPGCSEPITCKYFKNKQARFHNRKRQPGWLTPTVTHLVRTHVNFVKLVCKFLPVTSVVLEANRFAFMKLDDPGTHGRQYQQGPLFGFGDVREALGEQQGGRCLLCGGHGISQVHHIVPRSKGGSNTLANLAGLCDACHDQVHKDQKAVNRLSAKKAGINKRYHALSALNQAIPYVWEELLGLFPGNVSATHGWETKNFREGHRLEKTHAMDAYAIACSTASDDTSFDISNAICYQLKQYRRHDRQACHKENCNRLYKLDGKTVAVNRHKAIGQTKDSLEEYTANGGRTGCLTVSRRPKQYKRMDRVMPGSAMSVNGCRKILKGTCGLHNGRPDVYVFENGTKCNARKAAVAANNKGIIFVSKIVM